MLKSMRYFYHIFVSPGDAPGAITLNVVWMEREFDAYKLSPCMCPLTITVSEIQRDIGRKSSIFSYPLCIRHPRYGGSRWNSATPFGTEKLEWLGYHMVKKISKISLFVLAQLKNVTDGQTDTG